MQTASRTDVPDFSDCDAACGIGRRTLPETDVGDLSDWRRNLRLVWRQVCRRRSERTVSLNIMNIDELEEQ